jgi:hypothetical protein
MEARYTAVATVLLKIGKRELQKWVFNRKEAFFTPSHRSSSQCVACVLQLLLPETVIAAVLLFHERSVGEIVANLRPGELEQVIKLVGRRPSCYPPGALDVLKGRKQPPRRSTSVNVASGRPAARIKPGPEDMRRARERRLAMLRTALAILVSPRPRGSHNEDGRYG